jgi:hypothetical protein
MNEGMAVWAEDNFADLLNRYLDEAGHNFNGDGYMVTPERSLESGPFDYKTSLFWRYIAEQQSALTSPANEPAIGANVIGEILDTCNSQGWVWFGLMEALRKLPWYQDFFFFEYADQAQTQLKRGETTFGNFALAAYLKDLGPNVPDRRFTFMEAAEEIRLDDFLQPIEPSEPSQKYLLPVSLAGTGLVSASAGNYFADSLDRFASRYYEIKVDPSAATLEFQFNADPGLNSVLFQAVLIDKNNKVREIYRSARTNYRKRFPNARNNVLLDRIALVASGCDSDGGFTLGVGAIKDPSPDVMITRWHTALQTEYEIDSRNWSWTWVSPDIWTNNAIVYFNTNNKLNVRLHNKGNMDGGPISITLDYQDASGVLPNPPWLPVCDLAGANQDLYGLSLPAQSSNTWQVDWCPVPSGFSHHFCIRVKVLSLGEVNTDNKCAFSNFGHVVTPYGGAGDVSLPRGPGEANRSAPVEMLAVPRFGHEFELARRDLREQRVKLLEPGETSQDALRIYHRPAERKVAAQAPAPQVAQHASARPCTAPPRPSLRVPDPYGDYPADPRTLPPGVAGKPMVTLVYRRGNQVTGGITLLLSHGDKPAGQ